LTAPPVRPDRAWIAAHIPHQGRMCLLDTVLEWDASRIVCRASTHRASDHPLRSHGRLGAAAGIEYAAQSMAVHGALCADAAAPPQAGFLAGLRRLHLRVARLDDIEEDIETMAARIAGDPSGAVYDFELRCRSRILLEGRATVVFDAAPHLAHPAETPAP
jgi:predicted hotdog family 3-hydroxylacyl-ACP dehydratase